MDDNIEYSKVINTNLQKGEQVRLVVNDFNNVTYFQLRKYYQDYEGEWLPTKQGISIPLTFENTYAILDGMLDICSKAEATDIINKYKEKLDNETI